MSQTGAEALNIAPLTRSALLALDKPVSRPSETVPRAATPAGPALPASGEAGFSVDSRLLGPVSAALIPLNAAGDRLHVQFTVDRHATAALITGGSGQLDQTLAASGLRLQSLTVAIDPRQAPATPQPDPQHGAPLAGSPPTPHLALPSSTGDPAAATWSSARSAPQDTAAGAGARDPRREQQNAPSRELWHVPASAVAAPTRDRFA